MSNSRHLEYLALVGKWVHVAVSNPAIGLLHQSFGRLDDVDEGFLYMTAVQGGGVCVPLNSVRSVRVVEIEPQGEAGRLLRPADAPDDDDRLLRPAGAAISADPETLLRPAGESNSAMSPD